MKDKLVPANAGNQLADIPRRGQIDVSFYHFATPLIVGLPRLIKTIYSTGQNLFVVCKTHDDMNELDRVLWTFSSKEFIPHGTSDEDNSSLQPVLLSTDSRYNKNFSEILLDLDASSPFVIPAKAGTQSNKSPALAKDPFGESLVVLGPGLRRDDGVMNGTLSFKKYLHAFYGNQEEVSHMLDSYQECRKREDIEAVFWKQDHSGKWSNPIS